MKEGRCTLYHAYHDNKHVIESYQHKNLNVYNYDLFKHFCATSKRVVLILKYIMHTVERLSDLYILFVNRRIFDYAQYSPILVKTKDSTGSLNYFKQRFASVFFT